MFSRKKKNSNKNKEEDDNESSNNNDDTIQGDDDDNNDDNEAKDNSDNDITADNDEDDGDELDNILATMDIDNDFDPFVSITDPNGSTSNDHTEQATPTAILPDDATSPHDDINDNTKMNDVIDESRSKNDDENAISTVAAVDPIMYRIQREEVFSKRYQPTTDEMKEIKDIENALRIHRLPPPPPVPASDASRNVGGGFFRTRSVSSSSNNDENDTNSNNTSSNNPTKQQPRRQTYKDLSLREQWDTIVHPIPSAATTKSMTSILLKRSDCRIHEGIPHYNTSNDSMNAELLLFPRGIIIIKIIEEEVISFLRKKTIVTKQFYKGVLFSNIDLITVPEISSVTSSQPTESIEVNVMLKEPVPSDEPVPKDEPDPKDETVSNNVVSDGTEIITTITIDPATAATTTTADESNDECNGDAIRNNLLYRIQIDMMDGPDQCLLLSFQSDMERNGWLDAFRTTVRYYYMNHGTTSDLGWQYQHVYTPGYTMAITTHMDPQLSILQPEQLDVVDEYNGYGPIHYAVKCNHVPAIRSLLEAGANPNLVSADGKQTPMYIAVRDNLSPTTVELLKSFGANDSKQAEIEQTGELFSKIDVTQRIVTTKREKVAAEQQAVAEQTAEKKRQARAVTSAMNDNMRKLQDRGDKINAMSNQASELHDGATEFGSLASKLKEKMMKKKWYQL